MTPLFKMSSLFKFQKPSSKTRITISKKLSFVLLAFLFYYGCTDVPLSYSTRILDSDIIGYWQQTDSTAIQIYTNNNGVTRIDDLKFDRKTKKYKRTPQDKAQKLFFTKIGTGGSSRYFVSQRYSKNPEDGYINTKFIATSTSLTFFPISSKYLDRFKKVKDGVYSFGTSKAFRNFVTLHHRKTGFFDDTINYSRKKSFYDLTIPRYKKPKTSSNLSTSTTNAIYNVEQARIRTYIPELDTWDNYSDWINLIKKNNSIKFFAKGIKISLEITEGTKYEFFASNLKYKETQRLDSNTTWYIYEGVAKKNNKVIGNLRLDLLGGNYAEFQKGINGKISRVDIKWDDLKESGSEGSTQQMGFLMKLKK